MSGMSERTAAADGPKRRDATTVVVVDESTTEPPGDGPLIVVGFTAGDARRARRVAAKRPVWLVDATPNDTGRGSPSGQATATARATDSRSKSVRVEATGSPTNLTSVGVGIERCCSEMPSGRIDCWVPSLTALLQYVDRETAYRFCNAVTNRIVGTEGTIQLRLCGDAHGQQTVATFVSLADAVVRPTDTA